MTDVEIARRVRSEYGLPHTLATPLVADRRFLGALLLARRGKEAWSDGDIRLLNWAANEVATAQTTIVYWNDGERELARLGDTNRVIVPLSDVPEHARYAVLAAEDRRFYEHNGFDVKGILRAVWNNLTSSSSTKKHISSDIRSAKVMTHAGAPASGALGGGESDIEAVPVGAARANGAHHPATSTSRSTPATCSTIQARQWRRPLHVSGRSPSSTVSPPGRAPSRSTSSTRASGAAGRRPGTTIAIPYQLR